jgi:hypothetical protein
MTLDEVLIDRLSADTALVAIIGTNLFPDYVPKGIGAPAVVLHRLGNMPVAGIRVDTGCYNADYQVTLFGRTKSEVRAMEARVFAALTRGPFTSADVSIYDLKLSAGEDGYSPDDQAHSVPMLASVFFEDNSL